MSVVYACILWIRRVALLQCNLWLGVLFTVAPVLTMYCLLVPHVLHPATSGRPAAQQLRLQG